MNDENETLSQVDFITPMVAIGDLDTARRLSLIKSHEIEAVLSMEPVSLEGVVPHHLQLEVVDRVPLPFETISTAVAFIDRHVREGRRVFLHCKMGISRSPALAACYLHEIEGMAIDEAIAHVKSVRPSADPFPELIESIHDYYRNKTGAKTR